jgi:hypothetical protein
MLNELKKVASKNCGACGDAFAVGNGLSVVCWANSDGTFSFAVSLVGCDVKGFTESSIEVMMINKKVKIFGANQTCDQRGLVA